MRLDNQLFRVAEIALRNEERSTCMAVPLRGISKRSTNSEDAAEKEKENVSKTNT